MSSHENGGDEYCVHARQHYTGHWHKMASWFSNIVHYDKGWVARKIHGQTFIITLAGRHQDCSDVSATYRSLHYSFTAKMSTVNSFLVFFPNLHLFSCPGCNESKQSKQRANRGSKTLNRSRNTKPALRGCKSTYITTYTKNIQNGER